MGYVRNPATGRMEKITEVTGTITLDCGCRIAYDDDNADHQAYRLRQYPRGATFYLRCVTHGTTPVIHGAWMGPADKLIPDPEERARFEYDMQMEKSGCYDDDVPYDVDEETPVS